MATLPITFYRDTYSDGFYNTPRPPWAHITNGPRNSGWAIAYGYWLDGESTPRTGVMRHDVGDAPVVPITINPPLMAKLDSLGRNTPFIAWDAEITVPDEWRDVYIAVSGRIFFPFPNMLDDSFKAIVGGPSTTSYTVGADDVVIAMVNLGNPSTLSPDPFYPNAQVLSQWPGFPYGARSLRRDYSIGHIEGLGLDELPLEVAFERPFSVYTSGLGSPLSPFSIRNFSQHEQAVSFEVEIEYGDDTSETTSHSTTIPAGKIYNYSNYYPDGFRVESAISPGVIVPVLLYRSVGYNAKFGFSPVYAAIDEGWGTPPLELYNGPVGSWQERSVLWNPNFPGVPPVLECVTHAFRHQYTTEQNAKARWRLKDGRGLWSRWVSARNTPPVAVIRPDGEWDPAYEMGEGENKEFLPRWLVSETILLDASKAFDIDGTIVNYHWNISEYNANPIYQEFESSEPTLTYTFRNPQELSQIYVYLTVTDNEGLNSALGVGMVLVGEQGIISAHSDPDGVAYVAVNSGANLQLKSLKGGPASAEVICELENYDTPSVYQHPGSSVLFLMARDKSSNEFQLFQSDDTGRTFTIMGTTPLDGATYKSQRGTELPDGSHGACAVVKTTSNVVFCYSRDGVNWSDPETVGTITDGAKTVDFYHMGGADTDRVVITNGGEFMMGNDSWAIPGNWEPFED